MLLRSALLMSLLITALPAEARLTSTEAKMKAKVEADYEGTVAFLEKMVNQNSGTMNLAGVEAMARMVTPEFEALGFKVTWTPMKHTGRAGHLVAVHEGKKGGKRMLLIGHLDTVFELDSPFQSFTRKGNDGVGPGAGDDKGGIAVMLSALKAMKAAGTLRQANIEVHLTGDEEEAGEPLETARAQLVEAGKRADVALDFEGLVVVNGADMGSIARRSSNNWSLTTSGKTGHSSLIFNQEYGDGAIYELTRILSRFRNELPEPNLTFNVGLIAGGAEASANADGSKATASGKGNIIPATALASGDFRTLSPEQSERVKAKMEAIVKDHAPGTSAKIAIELRYPPMAPTAGNKAILDKLNTVNADLGLPIMPVLDPLKRGAGDISFVAKDVDGIAGLGPSSRGDHAPGETVDLISIKRQATRAAILMSRIAAEK